MKNVNSSHGIKLCGVTREQFNACMNQLSDIRKDVYIYYDFCDKAGELYVEAVSEHKMKFINAVKIVLNVLSSPIDTVEEESKW